MITVWDTVFRSILKNVKVVAGPSVFFLGPEAPPKSLQTKMNDSSARWQTALPDGPAQKKSSM